MSRKETSLDEILKKVQTSKNHFNLDNLTPKETERFFNSLCMYIFEGYELKSVEYDGKLYHNQPNMWDSETHPGFAHDPVTPCTGYDECEFENGKALDRFLPEKGKKIKYNIEFIGLDGAEEDDEDLGVMAAVFKHENIMIHSKPLVIFNREFNDDHRGSDHTRIILDFPKRVEFKPQKTKMEKFIDGLFRLKSHKFENYYEMYMGTKVRFKEEEIFVSVRFDHGS